MEQPRARETGGTAGELARASWIQKVRRDRPRQLRSREGSHAHKNHPSQVRGAWGGDPKLPPQPVSAHAGRRAAESRPLCLEKRTDWTDWTFRPRD
jgi:hypothetical protein